MREELDGEDPDPPRAYALLRHLMWSDQGLEAEPFIEIALAYMAGNVHASVGAPFLEEVAKTFELARPRARLAVATELWSYYELLGRHEDQLRVLGGAYAIAGELDEPGPKGRVLSCIAATHWFAGELDKVDEGTEEALQLLRQADDKLWIAKTVHNLGSLAYRRGRVEEAVRHWEEALSLRREIEDRKGEVSSMLAVAAVLPFLGRGDDALTMQEEALAIAKDIGERRFEGALHNNLGTFLLRKNRYEEAAQQFERAVAIARELGAQSSEALALGNLGNAFAANGRIGRAKACLRRAIEVNQEIDRPASELIKRIELAQILGQFGVRKQAQEQLKACIALAERVDDKVQLAHAERVLGSFLHEWGRRDEGWTRLAHALALNEELQNEEGKAQTLDSMGHAALNEQRFDKASELREESLANTKITNSTAAILTQCRLATAYRATGREADARLQADAAERNLSEVDQVSPEDGAEIHYRLSSVCEDPDSKRLHLTMARDLLSTRADSIRNGGYREHFLTRTGHNPETLDEVRRVVDGAGN